MKAVSIAAALATAVQGRALNVLHLPPTGHNPVRDGGSDYGVGPQQTLNDRAQEFVGFLWGSWSARVLPASWDIPLFLRCRR
jgi:hypothetical protein